MAQGQSQGMRSALARRSRHPRGRAAALAGLARQVQCSFRVGKRTAPCAMETPEVPLRRPSRGLAYTINVGAPCRNEALGLARARPREGPDDRPLSRKVLLRPGNAPERGGIAGDWGERHADRRRAVQSARAVQAGAGFPRPSRPQHPTGFRRSAC